MKKSSLILLTLVLAISLLAQTEYLGDGVFVNHEDKINVMVDTGMAAKYIDEDYVMFMVFMLMDKDMSANVDRKSVFIIYKGENLYMPEIKEFRENYTGDVRDRRMFQQTIQGDNYSTSQFGGFRVNWSHDFFPARNENKTPAERMTLSSSYVSKSKVYFKNPGFKAGDSVRLIVRGSENAAIIGSCSFKLPAIK